jgi:hypothetical protein
MPQLEVGHYITVFGICAAAVTALVVAYMQRRQIRQIEAYKKDPSVGLVPPPNPLRAFVRRHYLFIAGVGNAIALFFEVLSPAAITRFTVLTIALNLAVALACIILWLLAQTDKHLLNLYKFVGDMAELLEMNTRVTQQQVHTVNEARKLLATVHKQTIDGGTGEESDAG